MDDGPFLQQLRGKSQEIPRMHFVILLSYSREFPPAVPKENETKAWGHYLLSIMMFSHTIESCQYTQ